MTKNLVTTIAALGAALGVLLPTAAFAQEQREEESRFRWGISGAGGAFMPGSTPTFGVAARAGVQLSDPFGVYGELGYTFGFSGSVSSTSATLSGVGFWHLGALAELMFGDAVFAAAGPFFYGGGWGWADSAGNAVAAGGYMPGLDLRVGIGLGGRRPSGRRSQFTIGFDVKLFLATVTSVGTGSGTVRVGDSTFGILPMLMLGYDSK